MYKGLLIKESLKDEMVINYLKVVKCELWDTPNKPRYWTALSFESEEDDLPLILSKCLLSKDECGVVWFVDFKDDAYKHIVMANNIYKYQLGNIDEKNNVCKKLEENGVPIQQINWSE